VSYIFDGVTQAVGIVVRWVDTPFVPGPVMGGVLDSVGDWVLLALLQGDLHPQCGLALVVLAILHVFKELEIVLALHFL